MPLTIQRLIGVCLLIALSSCSNTVEESDAEGLPVVLDDRLRLSLIAEDPDIVTPIGLAIDSVNNIFVLESHTHTPPEEYNGPKFDQIKKFSDLNQDGFMDTHSIFAGGINDGMNLLFGPDGHLYVVSSQAVTRFPDRDGDGLSDNPEQILELKEPESVYDHAALLGITASPDGWLYVSRGNTGSKYWKLVGTDGSYVDGYGDGGNIVRCRLDGSQLEEVATGMWNPFDLTFSGEGRLLAIDNDPDSRGPNRLLDIVQGGDYGYKSLYGGSGIHPYVAWDGELPGTLPYVLGVGEAPSGVVDSRLTALPESYRKTILISIWEESKIISVHLEEMNGGLKGTTQEIVQGGQLFRPVAFATDNQGAVYFTDWVVREYPNHGRGRLWKLENTDATDRLTPAPQYAAFRKTKNLIHRDQLASIESLGQVDMLEQALLSNDVYSKAIARHVLKKSEFREWLKDRLSHSNAQVRIQAALVLESQDIDESTRFVEQLLRDPDEEVRRMALLWTGRQGIRSLGRVLDAVLEEGHISPVLFDTYVATIEQLQPSFLTAYASKTSLQARTIKREVPPDFFSGIMGNPIMPAEIRARAMQYMDNRLLSSDQLQAAVYDGAPALMDAAVFTLMHDTSAYSSDLLSAVILDSTFSSNYRTDAILALGWQSSDIGIERIEQTLHSFLNSQDATREEMRLEWVRLLRTLGSRLNKSSSAIEQLKKGASQPYMDQVDMWLSSSGAEESKYQHPSSEAEWETVLQKKGDVLRGRRVFFSKISQCSNCHTFNGWGGVIGPDLSNIGASKTEWQILQSILRPSAEIAPEWQGWYVRSRDGQNHYGRQIDVRLNSVELMTLDGTFKRFSDVENYGVASLSLMPAGLHNQLTVSDMRDLIAFLRSNQEGH